jgi:fucose 4-O-acetylase-like acetyltransferase
MQWVDVAKALGIIFVVYGHVARGLINADVIQNTDFFQVVDSVIYTFHMPLFFFLSGVFLLQGLESKDTGRFFASKVDTVLYPYIVWSLLQGGVEVILSQYTNGNVTWSDVFSFAVNPRAQFWFLYALLLVFFFCGFIFSLVRPKYVWAVFIFSFVLSLISAYCDFDRRVDFITNNLVFMLLGVCFSKVDIANRLSGLKSLVIILSALLVQLWFHFVGYRYTDEGLALLLVAILSVISVVTISVWLASKRVPLLGYIGASSMAIYLMHIFAGSGVRVISQKLLGIDSEAFHLIMGTVAGVVIPLLALNVIRRLNIKYAFSAPISRVLVRQQ